MKYLASAMFFILLIGNLNSQTSSFDFSFLEEITFSKRNTNIKYSSLGFAEPNLYVQPYAGGVYILGEDKWLVKPVDSIYVHSIGFNPQNRDEYFLVESSSAGYYFVHYNKSEKGKIKIFRGNYKLFVFGSKVILLGVLPDLNTVCYIIDTKTNQILDDFIYQGIINDVGFNGLQVFLACLKEILVYELNNSYEVLLELDSTIWGLELTNNQELILSLESGLIIKSLVNNDKPIKFDCDYFGDITKLSSTIYLLNGIEGKAVVFEY